MSHSSCWKLGVRPVLLPKQAPKGRTSTAQANGLGPRTPPLFAASPERAKQHGGTHADGRLRLLGDLYHALSGLENPKRVNFVTQAVGLGFVRSPRWG